jgi:hypothetical protein
MAAIWLLGGGHRTLTKLANTSEVESQICCNWLARLDVGFDLVIVSPVQMQLMTASLIGCLGQALFPLYNRVIVAHPGHASLRSLN